MLARSGSIPTRRDWAYEVKWDGFRAIVSTEGLLRVSSRLGWNMTPQVALNTQSRLSESRQSCLSREAVGKCPGCDGRGPARCTTCNGQRADFDRRRRKPTA
jgi:hypothetical protein